MSTTITALTTATGISATNDWFVLDRTSLASTQKINRNVMLGITGAPVGDTDGQTLTNKTIGNTNTVTLKDTLLTLQDDGDTTKQARFQLSGITTATTRTLTLPNASTTLVGTDNTATLTNKTLTSPVITGGTIDNSTITVDSIAGHTSSTVVTVAGVQLTAGTIGTASAVTSNSIATGAVIPNKLQSGAGTGWAWQSWVPSLTNLTLGSGTVVARYVQIGKNVYFRFSFKLGAGSAVGTGPTFTLPVTASSGYTTGIDVLNSFGSILDASTTFINTSATLLASTTTATALTLDASAVYALVSATVPFTFANLDQIICNGYYEAA